VSLIAPPSLYRDEQDQQYPTCETRNDRCWRPTRRSGSDGERPGDRTERCGGEQTSTHIKCVVAGGVVIGYVTAGEHDGSEGQRQVDEEDGAPAAQIDQPAAEHRPDRPGNGTRCGPDPNRAALGLTGESLTEDGKAGRRQRRSPNPLTKAGHEQDAECRGKRAAKRCECE